MGRVDVLARLIVDGMDSYEGFSPGCISGDLYIEIIPATFQVRVKKEISVSQLRLFYGKPSISEIRIDKESNFGWLISKGGNRGDSLCVDLTPIEINRDKASVFWMGEEGKGKEPIDLWKKDNVSDKPAPEDYWYKEEVESGRLEIKKDNFYILRSMERIALPNGVAVYCRAIDETIGEMRIHYAGFAHPGFGLNRKDGKAGTPLIFEVRGHGANVNLKHGEKLAKLVFYRMSEEPKKPQDKYNEQELELSGFFRPWK